MRAQFKSHTITSAYVAFDINISLNLYMVKVVEWLHSGMNEAEQFSLSFTVIRGVVAAVPCSKRSYVCYLCVTPTRLELLPT